MYSHPSPAIVSDEYGGISANPMPELSYTSLITSGPSRLMVNSKLEFLTLVALWCYSCWRALLFPFAPVW